MMPLRCSFCDKTTNDVDLMIAGRAANICSECVKLCSKIVAEKQAGIREYESWKIPA